MCRAICIAWWAVILTRESPFFFVGRLLISDRYDSTRARRSYLKPGEELPLKKAADCGVLDRTNGWLRISGGLAA